MKFRNLSIAATPIDMIFARNGAKIFAHADRISMGGGMPMPAFREEQAEHPVETSSVLATRLANVKSDGY